MSSHLQVCVFRASNVSVDQVSGPLRDSQYVLSKKTANLFSHDSNPDGSALSQLNQGTTVVENDVSHYFLFKDWYICEGSSAQSDEGEREGVRP